MEHRFFGMTATRAEAIRWLTIAEKLLSARDLMGSKSFATRARDSDPTLSQADQILAVADTLLAGDIRIGNNQHDWYSILRLTPLQGHDSEFVATQYHSLALLLNPQQNKFPFADEAFRLVFDAWSVMSNLLRKSMYDKELAYFQQQQQQQQHQPDPFTNSIPTMAQNSIFFGDSPAASGVPQPQVHSEPVGIQNFMNFTSGSNVVFGSASASNSGVSHGNTQETFHASGGGYASYSSGTNQEQMNMNMPKQPHDKTNQFVNDSQNVGDRREDEEDLERMNVQGEERVDEPGANDSTFWTACPYCYYMYEYPSMYADCSLKCKTCKRAFQAVVIPSPPPTVGGQDYCCWGFLPLGFSMENWEKNKGATPAWTPFSPMFTCPQLGNMNISSKRGDGRRRSGPRVYFDDDEVFVELSESSDSDDDWRKDSDKTSKRKAKTVKGKGTSGTPSKSRKNSQIDKGNNASVQDELVPTDEVEMLNKTTVEPSENSIPSKTTGEPSKKDSTYENIKGQSSKKNAVASARKQPSRGAKNFGKLDLNVECSNEAEEPALSLHHGNGPTRGLDENIEGNGFFEGLDEFLSSLPILNVVGDDKAVNAV